MSIFWAVDRHCSLSTIPAKIAIYVDMSIAHHDDDLSVKYNMSWLTGKLLTVSRVVGKWHSRIGRIQIWYTYIIYNVVFEDIRKRGIYDTHQIFKRQEPSIRYNRFIGIVAVVDARRNCIAFIIFK